MTLQSHPRYHEGFFAAQDGSPLSFDQPFEYVEGWMAFHGGVALIEGRDPAEVRREFTKWKETP